MEIPPGATQRDRLMTQMWRPISAIRRRDARRVARSRRLPSQRFLHSSDATTKLSRSRSSWLDCAGHHRWSRCCCFCSRAASRTESIAPGRATVRIEFAYDGGGIAKRGAATLSVNGKQVAQGRIEHTVPIAFSADEGTDVGVDEATNVTDAYKEGDNRFTGKIPQGYDRARVTCAAEQHEQEDLMNAQRPIIPAPRHAVAVIALCAGALSSGQAAAGGLTLYEVGTADVGLASAGYNARAQDASTVLTNPAGMTRLEGTQAAARRAAALRRSQVLDRPGHLAPARHRQRRQPGGLVPRRRRVLLLQRLARAQARLRHDRELRSRREVRQRLGRPLLRAGGDAARRLVPALDRLQGDRQALAGREPERHVRHAEEPGRDQQRSCPAVRRRPAQAGRQHLGLGRQPRPALRARRPHPVRAHLQLAGQARLQAPRPSSRALPRGSTRCSALAGC